MEIWGARHGGVVRKLWKRNSRTFFPLGSVTSGMVDPTVSVLILLSSEGGALDSFLISAILSWTRKLSFVCQVLSNRAKERSRILGV